MAYKSSFIGTFSSGTNESSSPGGYKSSFSGTFAAKKKREEDAAANFDYAQQAKADAEKKAADEAKKVEDGKSFMDKAGDVGNALKDAATEAYTRTGKGLAEIVGEVTGENQKIRDNYSKMQQDNIDQIKLAGEKIKDPNVSKKEKERWRKVATSAAKRGDEVYKESQAYNTEQLDRIDPVKNAAAAAEIALDVVTAGTLKLATVGTKTAFKASTKQGLKAATQKVMANIGGTSKKGLAARMAGGSALGGSYGVTGTYMREGDEAKADDIAKNVLFGATIGAAIPIAGKAGGKALRASDNATRKVATKAAEKTQNDAMQRALTQIGNDGIVGTLDKAVSGVARKGVYAASDVMSKTKIGSKVISSKDRFLTKWVSEFHPLNKATKRSDFEGKTTGAFIAVRESIGNAKRYIAEAEHFLNTNANTQKFTAALAATGNDLVENASKFSEFAKLRSESNLSAAGKKSFTKGKLADTSGRMAKFTDEEKVVYDAMYKDFSNVYTDLLKLRYDNGTITKELYDKYKSEPFDYIRVQREIPDWLKDKSKVSTKSRVSSGKSNLDKKLNKKAEAEQLDPIQTLIATSQIAHGEIANSNVRKTIYGVLKDSGDTKLLKTTDMVLEKQALLKTLKETKPLVNSINKTIRKNKVFIRDLKKEITWLNKNGKTELTKNLKAALKGMNAKTAGKDALISDRQMMDALVSLDSAELRKIRKMIEGRNSKLQPILDRVEALNGQLNDVSSARRSMWVKANNINTNVNKRAQPTLSFMDKGVENVYETDPLIASAVEGWAAENTNVLNNVFRATNNIFKFGTTGGNIAFALPNLAGDIPSAFINSKSGVRMLNPVSFLDSVWMVATGKPLTAKSRRLLDGYVKGNKGSTIVNMYVKPKDAKRLAKEFVGYNASKGQKLYTLIKHPGGAPRKAADVVNKLISIPEDTVRLQAKRAEKNRLLKKGVPEREADRLSNIAARENSVDFLEMGEYGRTLNSLFPYLNAGIQGSRTMFRSLAERPVSTSGKITAAVGVPTVATTVWNTSDPERKRIYDTIPEYVKAYNYVLIQPGAKWNEETGKWDGVFILKKPPGFKEFAEPVRKYIEYEADNSGDATFGGFLKEKGGAMATEFGSSIQPIDFSDKWKFINSVTPQALKPTLEAITGKKLFTGGDIVPAKLQDLPPENQVKEEYSTLTSYLGTLFGTSPLRVDHWIKATFGEVGTNAQHYIDRSIGSPEEARGGRSLPESVSRRFSGARGGADTSAFYDAYLPASASRKQNSSKVTELVRARRFNEAKRRAEEYNATIAERFSDFMEKYRDSPNYDEKWDEWINSLYIPTTDQAFKARAKQK